VLRLGPRRADHVQAELKRDLLIGPQAVEQRDRGAKGLEVQEMQRVFQPAQEFRERRVVDVRLAGDGARLLDRLTAR